MKLVVDENLDHAIADWLVDQGHDVAFVAKEMRAADDIDIANWALAQDRVILTLDHDFGELVFHRQLQVPAFFCCKSALRQTTRCSNISEKFGERSPKHWQVTS